ncbi:MAG: ATP-binding protein [Candidatus Limnocylindrales bacterium]
MRVLRLQARDVRRYRDLDIELAPGLTVVRGPNEAGKSTIQRILELALTRKVTSASADLDALRPWGAPEDSRPWVRLEFVQEDEDGVRHGSLEKSFRAAKGTVALEVEGETTTDPTEADLRLAEITGIPTEPFFRSTASVRHHEMDDLARDESALRDRLQASISGADRGTSAAKKKLDKAIKEMSRGGEKNPGRLRVAEEAVKQSAGAVEQGEAALALLERDRDTLASSRERRAIVEASLVESRALLEKARQAERLTAEQAAAQERFERYRTAVTVSEEIADLATTHPSPNPLPILSQVVGRLRTLDGQMRELRARLEGEVEVNYEVSALEPTWKAPIAVAIILVVIGIGLAGASALLTQDAVFLLPVGIGLVVIGVLVAIFARRQRSAASDLQTQKQLAGEEIDRRLRGRSQIEQELRQAELDSETQLATIGLPDIATAEALLHEEEAHVARIDTLTAQLDGLVGREPAETLPSLRDAAALEIEQKSGALAALGPIAREPRARERLESEVRDQESALDRARDDEANARARVDANTVDAEQVSGEAERLASWRDQLAGYQRRNRIYEQTLAGIEQAEQATMRTATRYLERSMVGDITRITSGRYRRVQVDDRTLDMAVFAPERAGWVDVRELSQGTLDQVYLAARLGLVRLVTGDRRPPLIFDDPFVTFDDRRATESLGLLRTLTADFQVIYLTTSDRYDGTADAVVVLPAPAALDEAGSDGSPAGDAPAGASDSIDAPIADPPAKATPADGSSLDGSLPDGSPPATA